MTFTLSTQVQTKAKVRLLVFSMSCYTDLENAGDFVDGGANAAWSKSSQPTCGPFADSEQHVNDFTSFTFQHGLGKDFALKTDQAGQSSDRGMGKKAEAQSLHASEFTHGKPGKSRK